METLLQDIKYGIRMLLRSPGFTLVALLALALGIGANTAIFSVVDGLLLRPLPYPEAGRLVFISEWSQQVPEMSVSMANFNDWRQQNKVFESMVPYNSANWILTGQEEPERLQGRQITAGLFPTLRVQPMIGRPLLPEDDKVGADRVVLISEGLWTRKFARDPKILGQQLILDGESYTVIGVLPTRAFHTSWRRMDVFTSLWRLEDKLGGEKNRGNHPGIYVIARLKPGVTFDQARAEMLGIAKRLSEQYPQSNTGDSVTLRTLRDAIVDNLRPQLLVLLGAVAFVLLIACANVANLLLARATVREKEIAVRTALGAGRWRIVRQLLTESALLSTAGGGAGLLAAYACVKALIAAAPANIPLLEQVGLDGRVLAFTAAISILTGLVFGLAPALQATRAGTAETLKEGGRSGTAGAGRHRMRSLLVVSEISLALVLLVGAGLMLKSFLRVVQADPGFRPEGVLTMRLSLPPVKYDQPEKTAQFIHQALEKIQAVPGVQFAGSITPLLGGWQTSFVVNGRPLPQLGQVPSTDISRVSPDYFQAMGIRLLQGRYFTEQDTASAPLVCIVDETMVKTYWPDEDPIGKQISIRGLPSPQNPPRWETVVGVVAHTKNYGVDQESRVEAYEPYLQTPIGSFNLVVRTPVDLASLTSAVRSAVRSVDPDIPVYAVQTLETILVDSNQQRRLSATLLGSFAGLALLLAAVGIYGVMSYSVAQRTHEIGIRMALGAQPRDVLKLVVGQGLILAIIGVVVGVCAALGMSRMITSLLFRVSATDPPIYLSVPLLLAGVALLASYIPARRAMRVDPMVALRYE